MSNTQVNLMYQNTFSQVCITMSYLKHTYSLYPAFFFWLEVAPTVTQSHNILFIIYGWNHSKNILSALKYTSLQQNVTCDIFVIFWNPVWSIHAYSTPHLCTIDWWPTKALYYMLKLLTSDSLLRWLDPIFLHEHLPNLNLPYLNRLISISYPL